MCRQIQRFFNESVMVPVETFVTQWEEACESARRWVEREVRREVETFREQQEERCRQEECNWWTLCLNKLFCWIVTVVVRVVEWVIEVVGEWVVETVCKLVAKAVRIVSMVAISVVKAITVFLGCLFTDPGRSLEALGELWFDTVSVIEDALDIVDFVLTQVGELVDSVGSLVADIADTLGPIGRFFGGIIVGALNIVSRAVEAVREIVIAVGETVTAVFRLDFCAALDRLIDLGAGIGKLVVTGPNVISLGANGVIYLIRRDSLRKTIDALIDKNVGSSALRDSIRASIRLNSSSFGGRWRVVPGRLAISSTSTTVDLRAMHNAGTVNLFAVAGYAAGCSDVASFGSAKQTCFELVYTGTYRRVSLSDLRAFVAGGAAAAPAFTLYPIKVADFQRSLDFAAKKFRQMAIKISYGAMVDVPAQSAAEFTLARSGAGLGAVLNRLRVADGITELCPVPCCAVYEYGSGEFGVTISQTIGTTPVSQTTGVTFRSVGVEMVFVAVLAHEMGHYFGLDHPAHDGFQYIMFSPAESSWSANLVATAIDYFITYGEPYFDDKDAENAWTWILRTAPNCVID